MRALKFLPILLALSACGVNPVTGKQEIQFVSPRELVEKVQAFL